MTRRSLELTRTLRDGKREGSLLAGDRPDRHADGGPAPGRLADLAPDRPRRDRAIATTPSPSCVRDAGAPRRPPRRRSAQAYDLERLAARVGTGRATPRDLVALARTLAAPAPAQGPADRPALAAGCAELEAALELCPEVRAVDRGRAGRRPAAGPQGRGPDPRRLPPRPRRAPRDRPAAASPGSPGSRPSRPPDRDQRPEGRLRSTDHREREPGKKVSPLVADHLVEQDLRGDRDDEPCRAVHEQERQAEGELLSLPPDHAAGEVPGRRLAHIIHPLHL